MTDLRLPGDGPVCAHPLAYLLGLTGVALMRAFAGDYDAAFIDARIAEVRRLLDIADDLPAAQLVPPLSVADGYDGWSAKYDTEDNPLLKMDAEIVHPKLAALPLGVALDAACGTGRHAAHLADLGHRVIGVDRSPAMLARARARVPAGEFHEGDLNALPVPDAHVDVIVCTLALTHVGDLGPVFAEFARVLKPGGTLIASDVHTLYPSAAAYPLVKTAANGRMGYIPGWEHGAGDFLTAALPAGLKLVSFEEPRHGPFVADDVTPEPLPPGDVADPWLLQTWIPAATNAAYQGQRAVMFWQFRKPG